MRRIRQRSLATCDSGSALAEIVIVLPLLVLLLIGLIEVGRYGNYTIVAGNAARAGVQYGAQNTVTAADITGMQTRALSDAQNLSGLTATASNYCECADGSASTCLATDCAASHRIVYVQVLTAATIPSLTNYAYMPASLRTITVRGKAVMRVAQ
ncbi:MAG: pilus assembly protein [Candidatus Eremiobacteraeota bacterium]|nr:pilus assembly protein [Candidatus Eremiobacteraeota bacterium]